MLDGVFLIEGIRVMQDQALSEPKDLLVRDGWIVQMVDHGAGGLQVPADAHRIEAEQDWVLLPGLIHAAFQAPVSVPGDSAFKEEATDPVTGPIPGMEYGDRRYLRGWVHAADYLQWDASKGGDWRDVGFTTAQVLPGRGVVRGRAATLSLNGLPLGQALLQREGHQVMALRGVGGYPGTPMASLAVLRQVLIDHQRLAGGYARHAVDPDLVDLGPAIFVANGRREIENVLDLLRDFGDGLPAVILGGRQAWVHAVRLREQKVAVLWRADFGEAPKDDEKLKVKAVEERPYWQEPSGLREIERGEHAKRVGGFLKLRDSGVVCALVPPSSTKDWQDAVQQLTDAGLSAGDVWQAASADVAEVLGLEGVGRVEARMGADFVILAGEPEAKLKPRWVFADGRGWEFEVEEEKEEGGDEEAGAGEGGSGLADGTWKISVQTPGGEQVFYAMVAEAEGSIEVTDALGADSDVAKGISFDGDRFKFNYYVEEMDIEFTLSAQVRGDSLTAKMATPFGDVPATGKRVAGGGAAGAAEGAAGGDEEGAQEGEEEAGEDEVKGVATGHPEWLIEGEEERVPAEGLDFTGSVLIQGGTLYALDGRDPFVGDLLIVDGRIEAVGEGLSAPAGVPVYDASGLHVSPGMLDAHSHLALDSVNEGSVSITAECRIYDMVHTQHYGIYRAAAGGTAMVQSLHGSANPIGGQAVVWEMDSRQARIADVVFPDAKQGIKFALGENVKQSNWDNFGQRFPNSRMGVQATYRRAFTAALDYMERRRQFEAGQLPSFRRDVRLEVLAGILANDVHIQCHSYRADELLMFLNVCKEFGILKPTFQHVLEGYKVAPELAEYGAMGSSFADWWAYKIEAYDAIPWNPGLMDRAGMVASINSDSNDLVRRLNTEAGKSLRYGGHAWDVAMRFATLNTAMQLHMDERIGSLEVGKVGTVAVWDAHPLSTYARCRLTLARGRTLFAWKTDNDEVWQAYGAAVNEFAGQVRERNADAGEEAAPRSNRGEDDWSAWTRPGLGRSYLIEGARIHSMVDAEPYRGWVLVEDGRIAGTGIGEFRGKAPSGTREIEARGLDLYPGFINATDTTGLMEIGSVRGTDDTREAGRDHPDLSVAAAIHADSAHHRVTRMNGITHVLVRPGRGRIRGQAALIQLAGDTTDEMVVTKDFGLVIGFPRASAPDLGQLGNDHDHSDHEDVDCLTAGRVQEQVEEVAAQEWNPREGVEMPDSIDELDEWFDRALEYAEEKERLGQAGEQRLLRDRKLEALAPYAQGHKPVLIEANDALTIMAARAWAKDRGLEVIYLGAKEAWKVAGYLGADRARVVLGSVHDLPMRSNDPYDATWRSASVLAAAGCELALRTDNAEVTRNLPFQAAAAAAWGWGREAALHALTLGAAQMLGVDQFTGSIETGKAANFFLSAGDPLDFPGGIRRMWIGGAEVELTSRQTELRDRYAERIERLVK